MKNQPAKTTTNQAGGALLVSLLLIFMLSIMGISAMRGSNLERRMATNSIHAAKCTQIAESSSEMAFNKNVHLKQAYAAPTETGSNEKKSIPITTDLKDSSQIASSVKVQYMGEGAALGSSLGEGTHNFVALRYEATGNAKVAAASTNCFVKQGAYQKAPATS